MSVVVPRRVAPPVEYKAGPIGPGAGPLLTEYLMTNILRRTAQQVMAQAATLWKESTWIRACERVISGRVSGMPWHLEDPEGATIDDEYPNKRAIEAYDLLCYPQRYLEDSDKQPECKTRRSMWAVTSRHMGVCGVSFWTRDQIDAYGIPRAYLGVAPWRMTGMPDDKGRLASWVLDADKPRGEQVKFEPNEIVQFDLEPPDDGFTGTGLVVSAINKVQFGQALDRHATAIVASGGRLSGIISPKQGVIDNDNIYQQLVRDWRNIAEQPEAAKRAQVVRYPIEFTKTVADMQQLEVVKLLDANRDAILELWGVPISQIGGYSPSGLNSGDVRKYDEAALWQNAISPRVSVMSEVLQMELNLWEPYLGFAPKFITDEPSFDDDSPRFDRVAKSVFVPMKGWERREVLGLEPLGPDVVDSQGRPVDDVILVANTLVEIGLGSGAMTMGPSAQAQGIAGPELSTGAQSAEDAAAAAAPRVSPPAAPAAFGKASLDQSQLIATVTADLSHQYPPALVKWVPSLTWEYDPAVKVRKIEATATRTGKIVNAIGSAMSIGAPVDPLVLVAMPDEPGYMIANGNKRYAAALAQGVKKLAAYVGTAAKAAEPGLRKTLKQMQAPKFQPTDAVNETGKADLRGAMLGFHKQIEAAHLPAMRASVGRVLEEQRRSVLGEVRLRYQHITGHPGDSDAWWKPDRWDAELGQALSGQYTAIGTSVAKHVNAHKADVGVTFGPAVPPPAVIARILAKAAERVKGINEWTRAELGKLIAGGVSDGLSPAALGDKIEAWTGWDEYRAERIATTELAQAYNDASLASYSEADVEYVQADDACTCDLCQELFGSSPVVTVDDAGSIDDHPNGTLEWLPVVTDEGQTIATDTIGKG